jgi:hypothetical protein
MLALWSLWARLTTFTYPNWRLVLALVLALLLALLLALSLVLTLALLLAWWLMGK